MPALLTTATPARVDDPKWPGAGIGVALVKEGSQGAEEAADVREYAERTTNKDDAPAEAFGSLADKLRGALKPREK